MLQDGPKADTRLFYVVTRAPRVPAGVKAPFAMLNGAACEVLSGQQQMIAS